jgi:hypothetical protein
LEESVGSLGIAGLPGIVTSLFPEINPAGEALRSRDSNLSGDRWESICLSLPRRANGPINQDSIRDESQEHRA